jgi:hypothetical protein
MAHNHSRPNRGPGLPATPIYLLEENLTFCQLNGNRTEKSTARTKNLKNIYATPARAVVGSEKRNRVVAVRSN